MKKFFGSNKKSPLPSPSGETPPASSSRSSPSNDNRRQSLAPARSNANHLPDTAPRNPRAGKELPKPEDPQGVWRLKEIAWPDPRVGGFRRTVKILTQNANGPCSLLALANVLILRGSIHIPTPRHPTTSPDYITYTSLSSLIGDFLVSRPNNGSSRLSISAALEILPTTVSGLDVNVGFDSIRSFEPVHRDANHGGGSGDGGELALFEFCGVELVHGWVVDESSPEDYGALQRVVEGQKDERGRTKIPTHDALQEAIVNGMIAESMKGGEVGLTSEQWQAASDAPILQRFLQQSGTQMTYPGLFALNSLEPSSVVAFFRNSHLSVLYRRQDRLPSADPSYIEPESSSSISLFQLVTDASFALEPEISWESLVDTDGAGTNFFSSEFYPSSSAGGDFSGLTAQEASSRADRLRRSERDQEEERYRAEVAATGMLVGPAKGGYGTGKGNLLDPERLLAVQSHVVAGYVGNRAATFPLQLMGYDVDVVNTVQFSNHTGYGHTNGHKTSPEQLAAVFSGLDVNGLGNWSKILTGYIPGAESLNVVGNEIERVMQTVRTASKARSTPGEEVVYLLDPVMGDVGKGLYVAEDVIPVYRNLLRLAHIITPNHFEMELLSQVKISSISTLKKALATLHAAPYGVQNVAISSIPLPRSLVKQLRLPDAPGSYTALLPSESSYASKQVAISRQEEAQLKEKLTDGLQGLDASEPKVLVCFASSTLGDHATGADQVEIETYAFALPTIEGYFSGVGDMFSALVLGYYDPKGTSTDGLPPFPRAVSLALLGVQQILLKTHLHSLASATTRLREDRANYDANNPDDCLPSDPELDSIPPTPASNGSLPVPARMARRMRKRELRLVQERGLLMRLGLNGSAGWPAAKMDWDQLLAQEGQ